jgi:hypothetical protein
VLEALFRALTTGIIFELLMRLRKYYEVDKIGVSQSRFALKEKENRQLQPYFKEYVAIWNQLERLRLHLLAEVSDHCPRKQALRAELEHAMNGKQLVEVNASAITLMQAMMRFRFDKLLKTSRLVASICALDPDFFREVTDKNLAHNSHVQDFLEDTINRVCEGIEKAV